MAGKIEYPCPVCDKSQVEVFLEPWINELDPAKLYGAASGIPGTQRLVKCVNCGMIFESPRYDAYTIIKGYMASQEEDHDSQYLMLC